jgi:hypothetical protein
LLSFAVLSQGDGSLLKVDELILANDQISKEVASMAEPVISLENHPCKVTGRGINGRQLFPDKLAKRGNGVVGPVFLPGRRRAGLTLCTFARNRIPGRQRRFSPDLRHGERLIAPTRMS